MMRAPEDAFRREDVVIAEVGRWVNLLDADAAKRRANLETVTGGLALAEGVGALCCVDIAGSFNPHVWYGPHPDNLSDRFFDAAVENARKIIDAVKPVRAKFCYEMMGWSIPDSPASFVRLLKAVDRPLPREGPHVGCRDERPLPRGASGRRVPRLPDVPPPARLVAAAAAAD